MYFDKDDIADARDLLGVLGPEAVEAQCRQLALIVWISLEDNARTVDNLKRALEDLVAKVVSKIVDGSDTFPSP